MVVQMLSMALTKRATTAPQKIPAASLQLHNKIGVGGGTFKFISKADILFAMSIGSSFTTVA